MYRTKRKKYFLRYGIIILALLALGRIEKNERNEKEVFRVVQESELEGLISQRSIQIEENDGGNEKIDKQPNIRVLIMGNGYDGEIHSKVKLSSKKDMCLSVAGEMEYIKAGEVLVLEPDDERFEKGRIRIYSGKEITIESLERTCGNPSYEGVCELWTTAEGIVIINELSVEKYLKAVVPSEMPVSYEMEALKVQAVCARSYAYRQMEEYGYPEYKAHVNDSTAYQVYGNVRPQDKSNQAVKDTKGEVVYYRDKIATTYYYSTSCGKTTDVCAWGTKKNTENAYLKSVKLKGENGDYEKNLPWYRWSAEIPIQTLSNLIGLNTGIDIGTIKRIEITGRGAGGIASEMKASGEKGNVTIKTENKIRSALGGQGYKIILNDGSVVESRELLPSAFISIEKTEESFVIKGGGFGHGIGMSQNGANEMAKQGMTYKEILKRFYNGIEIR